MFMDDEIKDYIEEKLREAQEETYSTRPPSSLEASTRPGTRNSLAPGGGWPEAALGWTSPELMTAWTQSENTADTSAAGQRTSSPSLPGATGGGPPAPRRPLAVPRSGAASPSGRRERKTLLPEPPPLAPKDTRGGMPVRTWQVDRSDTLPCRQNGRRHVGALDKKVRIYIYFPTTGDKMSLWVEPDLIVGPQAGHEAGAKPDPFEELWGPTSDRIRSLEGKGPAARSGKTMTGRRYPDSSEEEGFQATAPAAEGEEAKPTSTVLQKVKKSFWSASGRVRKAGATAARSTETSSAAVHVVDAPLEDSLKTRIFNLTGIHPKAQHLMFNHSVMDIHHVTLRSYGIGHGMSLSLRIDERLLHSDKPQLQFLATTRAKEQKHYSLEYVVRRKAGMNRLGAGEFRMMPKWMTHAKKNTDLSTVPREFDSIWPEPMCAAVTAGGGHGDTFKKMRVKLGILSG